MYPPTRSPFRLSNALSLNALHLGLTVVRFIAPSLTSELLIPSFPAADLRISPPACMAS
jgi:hypothetical protein